MTAKVNFIIFLLHVFVMSACSAGTEYYVPQISGSVVDKETKLPLDGAVIVSEWPIKGGYHGGSAAGFLPYKSALTDSTGEYIIPEQGVVKVKDYIDGSAPRLYIFKAGYKIQFVNNVDGPDNGSYIRTTTDERRKEYNRRSVWNGKPIELERFEGAEDTYVNMLLDAARMFNVNQYEAEYYQGEVDQSRCSWIGVDIPHWYEMLNREIGKIRPASELSGQIQLDYENNKDCQRWEKFYRIFKK